MRQMTREEWEEAEWRHLKSLEEARMDPPFPLLKTVMGSEYYKFFEGEADPDPERIDADMPIDLDDREPIENLEPHHAAREVSGEFDY
jgi:hypothetical protein